MPKVLFFSDPSNKRPGLGATIQLDSGEPCLISIAKNWVRVKKSRLGFWGTLLYNQKDATETAKALLFLFPDNRLPAGFTNPILYAFANAVMHCSSCTEVAIVLNKAVSEAQKVWAKDNNAVSDVQIVSD